MTPPDPRTAEERLRAALEEIIDTFYRDNIRPGQAAFLMEATASAALAAEPDPLGDCGFNEPHSPHEYVIARDGRPVDLSCPGLAAEPDPVPEVDAAWEALSNDYGFDGLKLSALKAIARHRPIIEAAVLDSTEKRSPESDIPAGEPCPICGPTGHGRHEDDSYGSCVRCYTYVPHSDVAYERVAWPCAAYQLEAAIRQSIEPDVEPDDWPDGMCPNCVTPWKCNGPHLAFATPPEPGT